MNFGRAGLTAALVAAAVLCCANTSFAQPNATNTIKTTTHDFAPATGPGYTVPVDPVTGEQTINHCRVCHGTGGPAMSFFWRHSLPTTSYDGQDWAYAIGDVGMLASAHTKKCMGCHEGDQGLGLVGPAINDYNGVDPAETKEYITGSEAFGQDLYSHHPVDIVYDAALATAQGALENPTAFMNPQGGGTIDQTLLEGGTLRCDSCHEQHNDRRFDLVGGDPSDDPEPGADSETHNYVRFDRLCFICHTHDQPNDGLQHHIPGRMDPYGDARGSDMACVLCHPVKDAESAGYHLPSCESCHHRDITRGTPATGRAPSERGTEITFSGGHHGVDRDHPYFNCANCHADPLTGILTGNEFGTEFADSCYECHDDVWNDGNTPPAGLSVAGVVDVGGTPTLYGTMNEALQMTAIVATNLEEDPLAYQWNFGDGSPAVFPSHDPMTSHTYDDYTYRGVPKFKASVSVTDGVNPPIYYEFDVVIAQPDPEHVVDTWTVTPSIDPAFDITFENHSGSLVGVEPDGQLSLGIEFVGVIYWMNMWMDISGNTFWGTGDIYFGNVRRGSPGTMDGVIIKADGSIQTFTGSGGAPPSH